MFLSQVKRALTLVRDGYITIETITAASGKLPTLLKMVNTSTGKESTTIIGFNDNAWGSSSKSFTISVIKRAESVCKFEKIKGAAKEHSKTSTCIGESHSICGSS